MPTSLLSPTRYVSGCGAAADVGEAASRLGTRVAVVAGRTGVGVVAGELEASLAGAGLTTTWLAHRGPCSVEAAERLAGEAAAQGCDVVVGVGGGRALDVTKGVAEALRAPYLLVPTSPATCAATTAVIVEYSPEGVYQRSRLVAAAAAYAFVDPGVLAAAPDRLLVAGLVDALAKAVEVRFAASRLAGGSAALTAALALCDDLERAVFSGGVAAVAAGPAAPCGAAGPGQAPRDEAAADDGDRSERRRLAEACVLWPGLIGALASEEAKLAAAHAVYNALTLLPGSRAFLHGEVMTLGVLTQLILEDRDADTLERTAALFARLGCPAGLAGLGCEAYQSDEAARRAVLERACSLPSLRSSFPEVGPARLDDAIVLADEVARHAELSPL